MSLTVAMRAALKRTKHAPLRRVLDPTLPGSPPWPAHPSTLHALARHRLVERGAGRSKDGWPTATWTITEEGRAALKRPTKVKRDRIRMLAHSLTPGGGLQEPYTADPSRAMRDEDEAVDPEIVEPNWRPPAIARHVEARPEEHLRREARAIGQRAREAAVFAEREGLTDELDALRQAVADIDRRRRAA